MKKTTRVVNLEPSSEIKGARSEIARQSSIPPNIAARIQGRVVDLSGASKFYRKQWEIYRPLLPRSVKDLGLNRYELSEKFLPRFERQLRNMLREGIRKELNEGADLIISVIRDLVVEEEIATDPDYDSLRDYPVWPSSRPLSEAWQELGSLHIPCLDSVALEQPDPGSKWRKRIDIDSGFPTVKVDPYFNTDKKEVPRLTIEVEGAPVCRLMRAHYRFRDEKKQRAMREEAKQLWDAIISWSSSALKLGHTSKGRPNPNLGYNAAFLHDHLGLSWAQVAHRLCPKEHRHTPACKENFRKQAEQYWIRLRKHHSCQSS